MADTTRHRRKKGEPDRINLEDWANAGALEGLLSFLDIPPEQAPVNQGSTKVLSLLEQRRQAQHPPVIAPEPALTPSPEAPAAAPRPAPITDRGQRPAESPVTSEDTSTSEKIVEDLTLPVIEKSWKHPKQATGLGNKKLYRCTLAQHGHSHTEEALYQILWRSGNPETDDTRLAMMGYGEIAKRLRLSFNNAKLACRRLIVKLAIEETAREVSDKSLGKTYRVFSYRRILERRQATGMEWVIRNKGVEFVSPPAPDSPTITDPPSVIAACYNRPPSETGRGGVPVIASASYIRFDREYTSSISSSSEVTPVLRALSEYGNDDDDVALKLISQCQNLAPDCTVSEIVHFIHLKGALIRRSRRITNPMGFLLTAVPKCFAGEAFRQYRQEEKTRQEAEAATRERQEADIERWRKEQETVLNDPNSPEEDKRFARRILGIEPEPST